MPVSLIRGKAFVLGNDVDTDQIIPARHLVYNLDDPKERKFYGQFALSGVPIHQSGLPNGNLPFVEPGNELSCFSIVVGGRNFGCGSSREHAPVALQMAGVRVVIAESYARIFYRNAVDGGYFIPYECRVSLPQEIRTNEDLEIDTDANLLRDLSTKKEFPLSPLGDVSAIVAAGGIFEYAKKHNMLGR
ncbi:3-isopropylmalate dehydratase [bacterium]|nr:3-isopropylmalate dehydratase [bacterium]